MKLEHCTAAYTDVYINTYVGVEIRQLRPQLRRCGRRHGTKRHFGSARGKQRTKRWRDEEMENQRSRESDEELKSRRKIVM